MPAYIKRAVRETRALNPSCFPTSFLAQSDPILSAVFRQVDVFAIHLKGASVANRGCHVEVENECDLSRFVCIPSLFTGKIALVSSSRFILASLARAPRHEKEVVGVGRAQLAI